MRANGRAVALLLGVLLVGREAGAYPSAVVFAPSGEARALGTVGAFGYTALTLSPQVSPGVTWFGLQAGLLPSFQYGHSGLSFGGLEAGVDLLNADLQGTPQAYVKPMLNAKVQVLAGSGAVPSASLGIFGVAPFHRSRSLDLLYFSATEALSFGERSYGKLTLGLARGLNDFQGDPFRAAAPVFRGGWPFSPASRLAPLSGYASPSFGKFSIALDHVGGVGEISSTNLAVNFTPLEGATLALGGYTVPFSGSVSAGAFAYLFLDWSLVPHGGGS